MNLLIRGKYVLTDASCEQGGLLEDGAVLITGQKIAAVDTYQVLARLYPEARVIGNGKQLIMPGLIDAHSHGRGLSPIQKGVPNDFLENNLLDWAFMPVLDPELITALCAVRHIRSGSTLIHNNAFDSAGKGAKELAVKTIETYLKTGIRLAYSPGVRNIDKFVLDTAGFLQSLPPEIRQEAEAFTQIDSQQMQEDYFSLFEELYHTYHSEFTQILLSPSWAQACTPEFLLKAKAVSDRLGKLPVHMHCLQTPVQKAFSLRKYGKSAIQYLLDLGLLGENTVLAHTIWVTEQDLELMAAQRVSVTSHPSCNLGMRNGITPVYFMQQKGIDVALGMDDKTINDDEDIIMEMRMMHRLHRVSSYDLTTPPLTALDVIKMATVNGAKVTGFKDRAGLLKPGALADLVLVDLERICNTPWMSEHTEIPEALLYRGLGADVNTVIIGGSIVMQERKILTVDEASLYAEIRKAAAKGISPEQQRYAEKLQRIKPYYQSWYNSWLDSSAVSFYEVNSRL